MQHVFVFIIGCTSGGRRELDGSVQYGSVRDSYHYSSLISLFGPNRSGAASTLLDKLLMLNTVTKSNAAEVIVINKTISREMHLASNNRFILNKYINLP
jgi:hypothetical protein